MKLIEPNWVTMVRRVGPAVTMYADVLPVSSICTGSLISCDDQVYVIGLSNGSADCSLFSVNF